MDALAGSQGGAQMERLFTILDLPGPLDDHISGYFEKVRQALGTTSPAFSVYQCAETGGWSRASCRSCLSCSSASACR